MSEYDRQRDIRLGRDLARGEPAGSGSEGLLGKVTTAAPAVGKFLAWHPVTLTGAEAEGTAATLTVDTSVTRLGVLVQGSAAEDDILLFRWADYRWITDGKPSSDCDPATTKVNVTVLDCFGLPLVGATVDVTFGGLPYDSVVTGAGGVATIGLTKKGTYSITASADTFTDTTTSPVTVTTCGTTQTRSITMTVPAGRICCGSRTYPGTLFLTTPAGTVTLVYDSFQGGWFGEQTVTTSAWLGVQCFGTWFSRCDVAAADRPVTVAFLVTCGFHVRMFWSTAGSLGGNTCFDATCTNSGSISACLPLSGPGSGGGGGDATADFSGGTNPILPQTTTLPTVDSLNGCPAPVTGDAILDE